MDLSEFRGQTINCGCLVGGTMVHASAFSRPRAVVCFVFNRPSNPFDSTDERLTCLHNLPESDCQLLSFKSRTFLTSTWGPDLCTFERWRWRSWRWSPPCSRRISGRAAGSWGREWWRRKREIIQFDFILTRAVSVSLEAISVWMNYVGSARTRSRVQSLHGPSLLFLGPSDKQLFVTAFCFD